MNVTAQDPWLVVDSGLRPADENMALDKALLQAMAEGNIPSIFRFLRFEESALVGYHQSPDQELNLAFCQEEGIAVQRRLTGGGALIFDPTQIGWELVCHRQALPKGDMAALSRQICLAAAAGLSTLGVQASFRPRNDIEVEGKKISGTGGIMDGEVLLFQGTVLVDLDIPRMLRVLRVPLEKLDAHAISSVAERVTSLKALLGKTPALSQVQEALLEGFRQHLGLLFTAGDMPEAVMALFPEMLAEIRDPEWLNVNTREQAGMPLRKASLRAHGGTLQAEILWDSFGNRIRQVHFSGDYFIQPRRAIVDMEAALRNVQLNEVDEILADIFEKQQIDGFGLQPEDFASVLRLAAEQP
ncbi:biotin/lipoate A/B protein ligase family protein [Acidithiobacillus sp. M4-SHS-6]|uniref:lipoate--protein ligase family protein n=1 Tax=Acidithiobacillus sp. M4-SHS-6 TaxID=3383024 RepID=UPI0039BEC853